MDEKSLGTPGLDSVSTTSISSFLFRWTKKYPYNASSFLAGMKLSWRNPTSVATSDISTSDADVRMKMS